MRKPIYNVTLCTLLLLQMFSVCVDKSIARSVEKSPIQGPLKIDITYDTSQIVEIKTYPDVVEGDYTLVFTAYRNPAYPCKGNGAAIFVMMERKDLIGHESPLWVEMHGGAIGYYEDNGVYVGETSETGVPLNIAEENPDALVDILEMFINAGVTPSTIADFKPFEAPNFIARRVMEGARVIMPSMCELDLYAGVGEPEAGNPRENARRTGLLATMAAIDYIANNNSATPTSQVYIDGHSAGAVGAWHVVQGFTNNNVKLNGAILDSGFVGERTNYLPLEHCIPTIEPSATQADIDKEVMFLKGFMAAVSPFTRDSSYWVENALGTERDIVPVFAIEGVDDFYCGGSCPLFTEAADAGFTRNCDYVLDPIKQAVKNAPDRGHRFLITVKPPDHQVSFLKGPHQAELESWFLETRRINNSAPWPRK